MGRKRAVERGRGRGRIRAGMRPVGEDTRIQIQQLLETFQASNENEYTFEADLNNHDRAVVHEMCLKFGFKSKSYGHGSSRRVTVFKLRQQAQLDDAPVSVLPLVNDSVQALGEYFKRFPPTTEELDAAAAGVEQADSGLQGAQQQKRSRKRARAGASSFSQDVVAAKHEKWKAAMSEDAMKAIHAARASLPISQQRQDILTAIENNRVVLVAGETGCGKTTQVPQYILEHAWERGKGCRVICTQPRRISAVSVSERVAAERGEKLGDTVGYTIRLDSVGGPDSSLMFCTNGVLLRMITHDDDLSDLTHIIVDEIHERDRFADFLLIVLRDLLKKHAHLRLVLMSATLHTELFSNYFGGCTIISVPGFTHPVEDYYLEDVLRFTGYEAEVTAFMGGGGGGYDGNRRQQRLNSEMDDLIMKAFIQGDDAVFERMLELTGGSGTASTVNAQHSKTGATPLMVAAGKGRLHEVSVLLSHGADVKLTSTNGMSAVDWARKFGHEDIAEMLEDYMQQEETANAVASSSAALSHYHTSTDAEEVDLDLMLQLLQFICREGRFGTPSQEASQQVEVKGAILVFLPGWDEIVRLKERLESSPCFPQTRYSVLPLHSLIAPAEQRKIFLRPPIGVRKIVLATNMAETAITIDDIVCVIDSGRLKEKSYDPYTSVSTLQATWISKASERQRRGRAGRCQPGVCFHMYSKARSESMAEYQLPELKRSPLDELGLQVKAMEGVAIAKDTLIKDFLAKAVEPPLEQAIQVGVRLLEDIGALTEKEELTVLGRHLAALPLPPRLGKLLMFAILFKCLDPILTVACSVSYRDPFVLPVEPGARKAAEIFKTKLDQSIGGNSDHLVLVRAYNEWVAAKQHRKERQYCAQNFLSNATMTMLDGMRSQLLKELQSRGLVTGLEDASTNAENVPVVRSVLALGFYPSIGRLSDSGDKAQGRQQAKALILTRKNEKAKVHPASVNRTLTARSPVFSSDWMRGECAAMVYDELTRGDMALYVKQCTLVRPHALLLVCAHLHIDTGDMDGSDDDMPMTNSDTASPNVGALQRMRLATPLAPPPAGKAHSDDDDTMEQQNGGKQQAADDDDDDNGVGQGNADADDDDEVDDFADDGDDMEDDDDEDDEQDDDEDDEADDVDVDDEFDGPQTALAFEAAGSSTAAAQSQAAAVAVTERVRQEGKKARQRRRKREAMEAAAERAPANGVLVVDGWLRFRVLFSTITHLCCLRLRLQQAFSRKVMAVREPLPDDLQAALDAIMKVFVAESTMSHAEAALAPEQLEALSLVHGRFDAPYRGRGRRDGRGFRGRFNDRGGGHGWRGGARGGAGRGFVREFNASWNEPSASVGRFPQFVQPPPPPPPPQQPAAAMPWQLLDSDMQHAGGNRGRHNAHHRGRGRHSGARGRGGERGRWSGARPGRSDRGGRHHANRGAHVP